MCRARFKLFSFIQFNGCPNNLEQRVPRSIQPLLAYLLLYRARFHNRQVLSEALWNGLDPDRAQRRLSTALWRLRRLVPSSRDDDSNRQLRPNRVSAGRALISRNAR